MVNCPICSNRFPGMDVHGENHIRNYSVITCSRCKAKLRLVEGVRNRAHLINAAIKAIIGFAVAAALTTVSKIAAVIVIIAVLLRFSVKMKKLGVTKRSYPFEFQLELIPEDAPFTPSDYLRGKAL